MGGNAVTFVLTDGHNNWDNNNGNNYQATLPGVYSLKDGQLTTVQTFGKACPGSPQCSAHGSCSNSTFTCACDSGYFGADCSGVCPGGAAAPCSGHGTCGVDGSCTCAAGWASCSAARDCSTSVASDPKNCGACGALCEPGPGVASATCSDSVCRRTCDSGFKLCPDGSCSQGGCALPGCQTYQDNQCAGNVIVTDPSFGAHDWQTPAKGAPGYRDSFQSYATLKGHCNVVYDAARTSATVQVLTQLKDPSVKLTYSFGGVEQSSPNKTFAASSAVAMALGLDSASVAASPVSVSVSGSDGSALALEPLDFIWANPTVTHASGDYRNGQKGAIVEMFGWPHADIAEECADLAKMGYLGAKVYPAQEQVMSDQPFTNVMNPWCVSRDCAPASDTPAH